MRIVASIVTMDNLPNNRAQLAILRADPLIDQIVFVNQDSEDGTVEWLDAQSNIVVVHRPCPGGVGRGAGPGRNAGLDAAGEFDYVLMLDGGIRPLHVGTQRMLDWLDRNPQADAIAPNWFALTTDPEKANLRWEDPITNAFHQWTLSETQYGLFRACCWDGFRFAEHYPFGFAGWGVDDDEMMHRWHDAGIQIWVTDQVHPHRRGSGSYRRLFRETGIWPNQYGSNYEERLVWVTQEQPHHGKGNQWGEPWLTVVVKGGEVEATAKLIKSAHERLRHDRPLNYDPNVPEPYSVVLWTQDADLLAWANPRRLRQHHGDTVIVDGQIVRKTPENEDTWTGDFRIWTGDDWEQAVRPGAFYYGLVELPDDLDELLRHYDEVWPPSGKDGMTPEHRPRERRRLF